MVRRTAAVAVAALALACGPAEPAQSAGDGPVTLDEAWLAPLELPRLTGKPLVRVTFQRGRSPLVALLLDETEVSFTVFDGLESETFIKDDDVEANPLDDARALPLLTQRPGSSIQSTLRTAVLVSAMQRAGRRQLAAAALGRLAKSTEELRRRVQEGVAGILANQATVRYADGGSLAELETAMRRVETFKGTSGARYATLLLASLKDRGPTEPPATSPLDVLTWSRVRDLERERCTDSVGPDGPGNKPLQRLRLLGLSAVPALHRTRDARFPSRCLRFRFDSDSICSITPEACPGPDQYPIMDLVTVGELARRRLRDLAGSRREVDLTDVECYPAQAGIDPTAQGFFDNALREKDVAQAIAILGPARGNLRVKWVEDVAAAGGDAATAFLGEEAKSGPVLLSRVIAARALAKKQGASAWESVAPAFDEALRAEGAEGPRCDHDRVLLDGFEAYLRDEPAAAVQVVRKGFAGYGLQGRIDILLRLRTWTPKEAAEIAAREEVLAMALSDTRRAKGRVINWGVASRGKELTITRCQDPSPSDVAALVLGKKLGVAYACDDPAEDKAAAVKAITEKVGKKP